jgi:hypothetical protein
MYGKVNEYLYYMVEKLARRLAAWIEYSCDNQYPVPGRYTFPRREVSKGSDHQSRLFRSKFLI